MEHLDQVLLNAALNDFSLLPWITVDYQRLARGLWGVLCEESLPLFLLCEVKVHEDGVVRLLDVHVDVGVADYGVDLREGAQRVGWPDLQVAVCAYLAAAKCLGLYDVLIVVAISAEGVPELKASILDCFLAHHEDHLSVRHASSQNDEGLIGFVLLLVDVAEVVSKQDSMLLEIAATKIEELLRSTEQIRVLLAKHIQVLDIGDHGDKSGCFFYRKLFIWISIQVNYFLRRLLRCEVSADKYAHSANILSKELDVLVLELALSSSLMQPLCAIV